MFRINAHVDKGDTKRLSVTPRDRTTGNAFAPSSLVAVFTPPSGNPTTKTLADFTASEGTYSVDVTFGEAGWWSVRITATDPAGRTEVEKSTLQVHE